MMTLLALVIGVVLGLVSVKGGAFREGGGLVLLFLMVIAVVVAAIGGALSAFLPAGIAIWTGRIALGCLAFAVTAWLADR